MRSHLRWQWIVAAVAVLFLATRLPAEVRTWTDATGKHKTEAEFVSAESGKVKLRRADGKEVTLPLAKLSKEDRDFVEEQLNGDGGGSSEPAPDAGEEKPAATDKDEEKEAGEEAEPAAAPIQGTTQKETLEVAKRFFEDLRTDDRSEARSLLSAKAQDAAKGALSPLRALPKPDDGARAIKVGKAKVKDDQAEVAVQVRAAGALVKTTLHLRVEGDGWRVIGLSADLPDGEKLVDFEIAPPPGEQQDPLQALVGQPLPLSGHTLDGTEVNIEQFKGKVVLVDFWATWCKPCMAEMPNIAAVYQQYHEAGFEVMAVSRDENLKDLEAFVMQENPPWVVVADHHPDQKEKMGDRYGINGIPAFILVGRDGKVVTVNCRDQSLGPAVAQALAAAAPEPEKKKKKAK